MIIKIIPETDAERKRYDDKGITEIEHRSVREFMIFGNKIDEEGDLADFHEWNGSERYLMGSLDYFYQQLNDSRRSRNESSHQVTLANTPTGMIKRGGIPANLKTIDLSKLGIGKKSDEFAEDEVVAEEVEGDEEVGLRVEELEQADKVTGPKGLRLGY